MTGEAVDLEVDESGRDRLPGAGDDLLVGVSGRRAVAQPGDHPAFDEEAEVPARKAVNGPSEQRRPRAHVSPRAAERSPPAEESRERASPAARPQRSMRMASLALPPAS